MSQQQISSVRDNTWEKEKKCAYIDTCTATNMHAYVARVSTFRNMFSGLQICIQLF